MANLNNLNEKLTNVNISANAILMAYVIYLPQLASHSAFWRNVCGSSAEASLSVAGLT